MKSSCFCRESLLSRVTWARYLRCCILQKYEISIVLVIIRSFSLLNTKAQFNPSGSEKVVFILLSFFPGCQILLRDVFRLKSLDTIFLRKLFQMDTSFQSSLAESSQDCALYSSLLRTQASKRWTRIRISAYALICV